MPKVKNMGWWVWSVGFHDERTLEHSRWTGLVSAESPAEAEARARAYVFDRLKSEGPLDPDDMDRKWTLADYDEVVELFAKGGILIGSGEGIQVVRLPRRLEEGFL